MLRGSSELHMEAEEQVRRGPFRDRLRIADIHEIGYIHLHCE
jgi:hypothetical protein